MILKKYILILSLCITVNYNYGADKKHNTLVPLAKTQSNLDGIIKHRSSSIVSRTDSAQSMPETNEKKHSKKRERNQGVWSKLKRTFKAGKLVTRTGSDPEKIVNAISSDATLMETCTITLEKQTDAVSNISVNNKPIKGIPNALLLSTALNNKKTFIPFDLTLENLFKYHPVNHQEQVASRFQKIKPNELERKIYRYPFIIKGLKELPEPTIPEEPPHNFISLKLNSLTNAPRCCDELLLSESQSKISLKEYLNIPLEYLKKIDCFLRIDQAITSILSQNIDKDKIIPQNTNTWLPQIIQNLTLSIMVLNEELNAVAIAILYNYCVGLDLQYETSHIETHIANMIKNSISKKSKSANTNTHTDIISYPEKLSNGIHYMLDLSIFFFENSHNRSLLLKDNLAARCIAYELLDTATTLIKPLWKTKYCVPLMEKIIKTDSLFINNKSIPSNLNSINDDKELIIKLIKEKYSKENKDAIEAIFAQDTD